MKQKSIEYHLANFLDNHLGVHRIAHEIISSGEDFSIFKSRIYEEISYYLKSNDGIKNYGVIGCTLIDIQKVTDFLIDESIEDWYDKEYNKYYDLSDESSDNSDSDINNTDIDESKLSNTDEESLSNNTNTDSDSDSDSDSDNFEINFKELDDEHKISIGSYDNLHDYVFPFYINLKHFEKLNQLKNLINFEKQIFHIYKIIDKPVYFNKPNYIDNNNSDKDTNDSNENYIINKLEIEKKDSIYYIYSIGNFENNYYKITEQQMEKIYKYIDKESIHIYELDIDDYHKKRIFQIKNDNFIFMQCSFIENSSYYFYQFNKKDYYENSVYKKLVDISLSSDLYLDNNIQKLKEYLFEKIKSNNYIIRMNTKEYISYFIKNGFNIIGVNNGDNCQLDYYFELE
jgi:hypothetical protein